jgi:hypothetical protein
MAVGPSYSHPVMTRRTAVSMKRIFMVDFICELLYVIVFT